MARLKVNILGISELKWTGMGEFNSDDHYIYYCGQESLRRNGVAIIVNQKVQNAVLGCNLKNDRMVSVRFQVKPFNIRVVQVYAPNSKAEEAEAEWFYEDLQDLLELTPKKDVLCITGWGIDLDNCDIEWSALETNRDHSVVFETAAKYCISDSFVDHDGYSISSMGFLPTVVDIMVI